MATRRPRKSTTSKPTTTKKSPAKKTTTSKKPTTKKSPVKKTTTTKSGTTKRVVNNKTISKGIITPKTDNSGNTTRKLQYEYIRLAENANKAKFNEMGQKVQSGEVQWAYYAVDDDIGYHYYRKLK